MTSIKKNFLICLLCKTVIFSSVLNFDNISIKDGLSENYVNCVQEDEKGFIWIATDEGLNKYNGYETEIYRSNPFKTNALSGNRIHDIFKDSDGEVWISTDKSIDKYEYGKNTFKRHLVRSKPTYVTEEKKGVLWVCTEEDGLFQIDKNNNTTKNHKFSPLDPQSLSSNNFTKKQKNPLAFDSEGNLWIGTDNGLNFFNQSRGTFKRFFSKNNKTSISSNRINTLYISNGTLWVGTQNGLDAIDLNTHKVERYAGSKWVSLIGMHNVLQIEPFKKGTTMEGFWMATIGGLVYFDKNMGVFQDIIQEDLFGRFVSNMFLNKKGDLFLIVPQSEGIVFFNTTNFYLMYGLTTEEDFQHIVKSSKNPKSLTSNKVKNIFFDRQNTMWVSTDRGVDKQRTTENIFSIIKTDDTNNSIVKGLDFHKQENKLWFSHNKGMTELNLSTFEKKEYRSDPTNENSLLSDESGVIKVLKNGNIWVTSEYGGVSVLEKKSGRIKRFVNEGKKNQIIKGKLNTIFESNSGEIYLSSLHGSSIYDGEQFKTFEFNPSIKNSQVSGVNKFFEDKRGTFWVGTNSNGLFRVDKTTMSVLDHYTLDPDNPKSFASSVVYEIFETKRGEILIGSGGEGLFIFNPKDNNFDRITIREGLSSNTVLSITEDSNGFIWLGSKNGVSKIDLDQMSIQNYNESDGLIGRTVSSAAITKDSHGNIYFGGPEGISYIDPSKTTRNTIPPRLAIGHVFIYDKNNRMETLEFNNDSISVFHTTQTIEINYIGLSYTKTQKNKYQYKLKNLNKDWVENGTNRTTSFQGLKPGEYTFLFKASNNDGIWSESSSPLFIRVYPPAWKTWWAYSGYISLFALAAFGTVRRHDSTQMKKMEEDRRAVELEEARAFQMKMIPKRAPSILGLKISAGIKTATEVGGDYYDFFQGKESLYVAVGDATGHGMTAGMMVSITKAGLYGTPQNIPPNEVSYILNRTIKAIDLGKNKMAISIARFWENKIELTSAAMPPLYHYRAETSEVDEILLEGLPLGSFKGETYSLVDIEIKKGDVFVFISDGLPEATNISDQMLGYKAVLDCIKTNGENSAEEIKQSLFDLGMAWLDGVQNQDDITVVVVKKET